MVGVDEGVGSTVTGVRERCSGSLPLGCSSSLLVVVSRLPARVQMNVVANLPVNCSVSSCPLSCPPLAVDLRGVGEWVVLSLPLLGVSGLLRRGSCGEVVGGVVFVVGLMFGLGGGRFKVRRIRGGRCGGLGGGRARASLDPVPIPQVEPLQVRMNCWNAVSLSLGTSSAFTWLSLLVKSAKQKPRMNHRGTSCNPHSNLLGH